MKEEKDLRKESKQHFHSSSNGCYLTKILGARWCGRDIDNYYCHTHGVVCSKTGWELGWYRGTNSQEVWNSENTN